MTKPSAEQRCFLDSDVVISALISDQGAAYELLTNGGVAKLYTSPYVLKEVERAVIKFKLDRKRFRFFTDRLSMGSNASGTDTSGLVNDPNDGPIIGGAIANRCYFLITFNLKDYRIDEIEKRHNVTVLRPGEYLQYLRSLGG